MKTYKLLCAIIVGAAMFFSCGKNENKKEQTAFDINREISNYFYTHYESITERQTDSLIQIVEGIHKNDPTNYDYNLNLSTLYFKKKDYVKFIALSSTLFEVTNEPSHILYISIAYDSLKMTDSCTKYLAETERLINKKLPETQDDLQQKKGLLSQLLMVYCNTGRDKKADSITTVLATNFDTTDIYLNHFLEEYRKHRCDFNSYSSAFAENNDVGDEE